MIQLIFPLGMSLVQEASATIRGNVRVRQLMKRRHEQERKKEIRKGEVGNFTFGK
jgi:hypothetical protein